MTTHPDHAHLTANFKPSQNYEKMSMTERVYNDIVRLLEPISFSNRQPLQLVAKQYPQVSEETLLSIYSHLIKLHTKRMHWHHRKPKIMDQYYQSYLSAKQEDASADLLLQLAHKVSLSPAMYVRIVLEQYVEHLPPELLPPPPTTTPAVLVKQWMKNPHSIPDPTLQLHVKTCFLNDVNYGPLGENVRWSVGHEYEFLLREKVEELKVPFLDEEGLRARGYDKTPDIKLEVPIAVGGYIVNWIESKASFGDPKSHEKYLKDQFWSYQNRYGSGVVIYWFGFVEELNSFQDQGILLMERFPDSSQITTLQTSPSPSHINH